MTAMLAAVIMATTSVATATSTAAVAKTATAPKIFYVVSATLTTHPISGQSAEMVLAAPRLLLSPGMEGEVFMGEKIRCGDLKKTLPLGLTFLAMVRPDEHGVLQVSGLLSRRVAKKKEVFLTYESWFRLPLSQFPHTFELAGFPDRESKVTLTVAVSAVDRAGNPVASAEKTAAE